MVWFCAVYLLIYIGLLGLAIVYGRFPALQLNYYSVLFWIYYNIITNGLFLYHAFKVLDGAKKDEGSSSHNLWRVKTIGLYFLAIAGILGGVIYLK